MKRSFRSPERQAESMAKKMAMLGQKKERGKRGHEDGIHSVATLKRYEQSLKGFAQWRQNKGMQSSLAHATLDEAQAYLNERKAVVGQKALDADRHALQKLLHSKIETVKASDARNDLATKSRAYTAQQVEAIARHQSPANALATKIAYACGLRAHELHTIQKQSDGSYKVTGKGGLSRNIRMPKALVKELESRRLETPVKVKDRGVIYEKHYDIGGGNSFSKSFGDASKRVLGFSLGAHGLRHSYAQNRLLYHQSNGKSWDDARREVSRELGHFRENITNKYLR